MSEHILSQKNSLMEIASRLGEVFNLPQEQQEAAIKGFISGRIAELTEVDNHDYINGDERGGIRDFISSERLVSFGVGNKSLKFDDDGAYVPIIRMVNLYAKQLEANDVDGEKKYREAVVKGVNHGQAVYFQSWVGDIRKSALLSYDIIDDNDEISTVSISDVGRSAVCIQRAPLSHNALRILGFDSALFFGQLHTAGNSKSIDEKHAVVIYKSSRGSNILFDPTNPTAWYDSEGTLYHTEPTLKNIGADVPTLVDMTLQKVVKKPDGSAAYLEHAKLTYELYT